MSNVSDNELKITDGNNYNNRLRNEISDHKHDDSKKINTSIKSKNRQTTMKKIKQIVRSKDNNQKGVARRKERHTFDKRSNLYSDVRSHLMKKMTEKHDKNKKDITTDETNNIQEGDNKNKEDNNRYDAEDDVDNKVVTNITMGNDYLMSDEIKVQDNVSIFQDGDKSNEI